MMGSELVQCYLANGKMTILARLPGTTEISTTSQVPETNLLELLLNMAKDPKYTTLFILIGAGGLLYLLKQTLQDQEKSTSCDSDSQNISRSRKRDNISPESESNKKSESEKDLSLNCLTAKVNPMKFLKRPIYDLSQSIHRARQYSTRHVLDTAEHTGPKQSCQLTRLGGDGLEVGHNDKEALWNDSMSKVRDNQYRPVANLFSSRGEPDGKEHLKVASRVNSRCCTPALEDHNSLDNMVQSAREACRLIRESSFDSFGSDFNMNIFNKNNNEGANSDQGINIEDLKLHRSDRHRESSVLSDYNEQNTSDWTKKWQDLKPYKLVLGLGGSYNPSECGDDGGSVIDSLEWDNDCCYEVFETETTVLPNESQQWSLLPNNEAELDLESELMPVTVLSKPNSLASSRRSSWSQLRRLPPSGSSSAGPGSVNSDTCDDPTIVL